MTPTERLRVLAKNNLEIYYPGSIDREEDQETYEVLLGLDPSILHKIGTVEYMVELATEDKIFVTYRHLDEV